MRRRDGVRHRNALRLERGDWFRTAADNSQLSQCGACGLETIAASGLFEEPAHANSCQEDNDVELPRGKFRECSIELGTTGERCLSHSRNKVWLSPVPSYQRSELSGHTGFK